MLLFNCPILWPKGQTKWLHYIENYAAQAYACNNTEKPFSQEY